MGGDGSIMSVNYEKLFFIESTFFLTGKLGIGGNTENTMCLSGPCPSQETFITIPHHITGNLGKGRHFFEFGLGGTIINGETNQKYLLYSIGGYRIHPLKSKKINFRIYGSIPFSGLDTDDIWYIPLGLSLGLSFFY